MAEVDLRRRFEMKYRKAPLIAVLAGFIAMCDKTPVDTVPSVPAVFLDCPAETLWENGDTMSFVACLTAASLTELSVPFTTGGSAVDFSDYTFGHDHFHFPPGQTCAEVRFAALDDTLVENDETVVITLGSAAGFTLGTDHSCTVRIVSDDTLEVGMLTQDRTVTREIGTFVIEAALSQPVSFQVSVPYTVTGTALFPAQHGLAGGVFLFPPGETVSSKSVAVINDSLEQGVRELVVGLEQAPDIRFNEEMPGSNRIVIAYDSIIRFKLMDNTIAGWTESHYGSDFNVAVGEDLFNYINGGAAPYVEAGYLIALRQKLLGSEEEYLEMLIVEFNSAATVDSLFNESVTRYSPDLEIEGYAPETVIGRAGPSTLTAYMRYGNFYIELVVSGIDDSTRLLSTTKALADILIGRM